MTDRTLPLGIDSRDAEQGARRYVRSVDDIRKRSRSAARSVDSLSDDSFERLRRKTFAVGAFTVQMPPGFTASPADAEILVEAVERAFQDRAQRGGVTGLDISVQPQRN